MLTMGLSGTLRKHRKRMQLTQQAVADQIGIQRSTYSRYEEGSNRPSWRVLIKIADLYGITMDELVGRAPQETGTENNERGFISSSPSSSPSEQIDPEQLQKMLSLFWNASTYARETALLILENGQKDKNLD